MSNFETDAHELAVSDPVVADDIAKPRGWLSRIAFKRDLESYAPVADGVETKPARRRLTWRHLSFLVMVVAPSIGAVVYFAAIASDQFVSEMRFAVSAPLSSAKLKAASSGSLVPNGATEEAYQIAAYIRSRACIEDVMRTVDLRNVFRRPEADAWARLKADASPEDLSEYWSKNVISYVDPPSGIVTVSVSAFRREDALAVSQAILQAAEKVGNDISAKARADLENSAQLEVGVLKQRLTSSLAELKTYREQTGVVDPDLQAESAGQLIDQLQLKRNRLFVEYGVSSKAMSRTAPTLRALSDQLHELDRQIADETDKLTNKSNDKNALISILPKYEELHTRATLAGKLYLLAVDGLERAHLRAEGRAIYINVFVPPTLAEQAEYPKRVASSFRAVFIFGLVWAILVLGVATVEDHKL